MKQLVIEDTLRNQVIYKPKEQAKQAEHKRRPKRAGPNPETKAHTLMTQSLTVDTTNALLRLLPRLSPPESQQVQEHISSLFNAPPPPTSLHTGTQGQGLCTP